MTDPVSPTKKTGIRKPVLHGTLAALTWTIVCGSWIALGDGASRLGVTMFVVLPVATGFVTVFTARYWKAVAISLMITIVICLAGLVYVGWEGIICVIMAAPVFFVAAMLGAVAGVLVKQRIPKNRNVSMSIMLLLAGVPVLGAGKIEDSVDAGPRTEIVESKIIIDSAREDVWKAMLEFDQVDGTKPFLLHIGLPVPQSCTMSGRAVGSKRVCHFDSGFIRERITRWQPPEALEFDVEEVQLPGRRWLGFVSATYALNGIAKGKTEITRTTIVTSTLGPACYWRFFEHMGTQAEHDYILQSLKSKCESVD